VEGVEFLTAEIKVFKGETCENHEHYNTAVVPAGKVTVTALWDVKGVVSLDIISAVAFLSSEP
jgi:hypothetical protein